MFILAKIDRTTSLYLVTLTIRTKSKSLFFSKNVINFCNCVNLIKTFNILKEKHEGYNDFLTMIKYIIYSFNFL